MFDNRYNFYHTNFLETLQVQATVNSSANLGFAAAVDTCEVYYYAVYRNLTMPHTNAYKNKMFPSNMKKQMLGYSYFNEGPKIITETSTSTTEAFMSISISYTVSRTYFYIGRIANGTPLPFVPTLIGDAKIKDLTLEPYGSSVYNKTPIEILRIDNVNWNEYSPLIVGQAAGALSVANQIKGVDAIQGQVYCINWNIYPERNSFTGGVSFNGSGANARLGIRTFRFIRFFS